jgi:hypothetical protein
LLLVSPAQSFSGQSPAGLMTIFYCLRFETPPTWRARSPYLYPPGIWWPSYTPRHWVPFRRLLWTRRATVEVFDPASTTRPLTTWWILEEWVITSRHEPRRKHSSSIVAFVSVAARTCLPSPCPETAVVYRPISRSVHSNGSKGYNIV